MSLQLTIPEKDLSDIKKLVEYGIFQTVEEAVKTSVEFLVKEEQVERGDLSKAFAKINGFLMDNVGDLPFASEPVIIYHKDRKVYKFPIKTRIDWNKNILLGFVCLDAETFEIIPEISDSAEKLNTVCDRIAAAFGSTVS